MSVTNFNAPLNLCLAQHHAKSLEETVSNILKLLNTHLCYMLMKMLIKSSRCPQFVAGIIYHSNFHALSRKIL